MQPGISCETSRLRNSRTTSYFSKIKTTEVVLLYSLVVASLDKMLRNDYLCLVESGKQQIKEVRSKIQPENSEIKVTPKRVWIRPTHSASSAFS